MIVVKCPECGNYKEVFLNTENEEEVQQGNDMYCQDCGTYFDSHFDAEYEEV